MYENAEFRLCGRAEEMYLQAIKEINENSEVIRQDNEDLEELQWRYENLQLTDSDRNIIDDLFFCMRSCSERIEQLAYYAGVSDTLELINQ